MSIKFRKLITCSIVLFLSISIFTSLLLSTIQQEAAALSSGDLAQAEASGVRYIQQRILVYKEWDRANLVNGTEYHDLKGAVICYAAC